MTIPPVEERQYRECKECVFSHEEDDW